MVCLKISSLHSCKTGTNFATFLVRRLHIPKMLPSRADAREFCAICIVTEREQVPERATDKIGGYQPVREKLVV